MWEKDGETWFEWLCPLVVSYKVNSCASFHLVYRVALFLTPSDLYVFAATADHFFSQLNLLYVRQSWLRAGVNESHWAASVSKQAASCDSSLQIRRS